MSAETTEPKRWETTNVTNLLRNAESGTYYARVKTKEGQRWRTRKTKVLSVAKLRLGDFEKEVRAPAVAATAGDSPSGPNETNVARFIAILRARTIDDPALAPATKSRREIAVKALEKTWPELANLNARKVTPADCRAWAKKAVRDGTGFVAPNAKTIRKGMSASAFNKCVEVLRAVFEIAREKGAAYLNPADDVDRAKVRAKDLKLPNAAQFRDIVRNIVDAGARQSKDYADMVRLLAYSGLRLQEAVALR